MSSGTQMSVASDLDYKLGTPLEFEGFAMGYNGLPFLTYGFFTEYSNIENKNVQIAQHDDLKQMLDSNKDGLKLEAMKRIIGMVAKGRDASDLFPAVVKNVVSKNLEVKKLVYVYLVRYAEEQQDLALLSIATFQRALKDPNQLIRASALRVLSSVRVTMIVPIVMLAIKDSASDMSPYVRKTAAHAIPKLFSLDPEQKEELIQVIEKLLADRTTLVVGSAVMAFEEVCPDRIDLIHKNYRKLCNLLVDVDEWGQVVIMNMLVRYARTQFVNPCSDDGGEANKPFYEESDSDDGKKDKKGKEKKTTCLDPDHRLLLRQSKPLLQSRNAAVVMGVAQLYYHLAPRSEVLIVTKALIRLLRSHREVQSVVLNCIASMSTFRKGMFDPYLQSFFVRTSDPTHIKLLKLEILTNLATEINIGVILREFQTYISSHDKIFVAAAIQAIGRCAANIKEVTDTCLNGLVTLLSNRDEAVVAESVIVIKNLLQTQPEEHNEIISKMARLLDSITVPQARSSILWLLGEYSEHVPKIAPDVLRKMAKGFISEEDSVKMQVINLAVKLYLTNPSQTTLLCQYVLNLAKYDQNYDLRDRARFLRHFVFPSNENSRLHKQTRKIFLAQKPAPVITSRFTDREQFQLGSLSHYLNSRANGYHELPDFPEVAPESSVRNVELPNPSQPEAKVITKISKQSKPTKIKSFYSDSEKDSSPADESSDNDDDDEDSDEEENSSSDGEKNSNEDSESSDENEDDSSDDDDDDDDTSVEVEKKKEVERKKASFNSEEESSDETSSSEKNSPTDTDSDEDKKVATQTKKKKPLPANKPVAPTPKSNLDLLLDLDEHMVTVTPVLTPSMGGFFTPMTPSQSQLPTITNVQPVSATFTPQKTMELVNKLSGGGLQIDFRFTRTPHLYSPKMASIEFLFTNHGPDNVADIKLSNKDLGGGRQVHEFAPITSLAVGRQQNAMIGIDFNDSTQPINLNFITASGRQIHAAFKFPVGEIIRAVFMPETLFDAERKKLKGMNEHSASLTLTEKLDTKALCQRIYEAANVGPIPCTETSLLKFAGQTLSSQSLTFISVEHADSNLNVCVNCEKMVIGSMLLNELKTSICH